MRCYFLGAVLLMLAGVGPASLAQGDPGNDGHAGPQGQAGPMGDSGPQGVQGRPGPPGIQVHTVSYSIRCTITFIDPVMTISFLFRLLILINEFHLHKVVANKRTLGHVYGLIYCYLN